MRQFLLISGCVLLSFNGANAQMYSPTDAAVRKFQQFFNKDEKDSIFNMLSVRSKQLMPADKLGSAMAGLHQQVGDLKSCSLSRQEGGMSFYKSEFSNATLTLVVAADADNKLETFRFVPYKEATTEPADVSNMVLSTPTGKIYGSLAMPAGAKKVPVVLIIAGSGPTDRNCNSDLNLKSNAFKMLADSLKQAGIASVRYDKRGVGESAGALSSKSSLDFGIYVNDAEGFIKMLKADPRFSEVIVAGHSEGSLIGMIAAKNAGAKKYISIAGAGERINKTIRDQYAVQSAAMADSATRIMDTIMMGKEAVNVPAPLYPLFSPAMQPYMRSWLKYDPQEEIKKLQIPILIVQGDNDLQVSVKNADNLKKAAPKAKLVIIKKMNHPMKEAPTDRVGNFETYNKPSLPLCPGFAAAIVKFIKG